MGDGRAEGSSIRGDRGQAAVSLMPDISAMHICLFESSQLEGFYVEDSLYLENRVNFLKYPVERLHIPDPLVPRLVM